jgi:hypothetical protein
VLARTTESGLNERISSLYRASSLKWLRLRKRSTSVSRIQQPRPLCAARATWIACRQQKPADYPRRSAARAAIYSVNAHQPGRKAAVASSACSVGQPDEPQVSRLRSVEATLLSSGRGYCKRPLRLEDNGISAVFCCSQTACGCLHSESKMREVDVLIAEAATRRERRPCVKLCRVVPIREV